MEMANTSNSETEVSIEKRRFFKFFINLDYQI